MEKGKIRLEIYEGDPFEGTCCGPGPRLTSVDSAERLRKMLEQRNEVVKKLSEEYKNNVTIEREIISQKRWDYPEYVLKLMSNGKPLPYIFINEEPVIIGKFPSYEEFATLLKARLGVEQKQNQ